MKILEDYEFDFCNFTFKDNDLNDFVKFTIDTQDLPQLLPTINSDFKVKSADFDIKFFNFFTYFLSFYYNIIIFNKYYSKKQKNINKFLNTYEGEIKNEYIKLINKLDLSNKENCIYSINELINEMENNIFNYIDINSYTEDCNKITICSLVLAIVEALNGDTVNKEKEKLKKAKEQLDNKKELFSAEIQTEIIHLKKMLNFYLK